MADKEARKWKKIGVRSYELRTVFEQAFVFRADRPACMWAVIFCWEGGSWSHVFYSLKSAKHAAEEKIVQREARNNADVGMF